MELRLEAEGRPATERRTQRLAHLWNVSEPRRTSSSGRR